MSLQMMTWANRNKKVSAEIPGSFMEFNPVARPESQVLMNALCVLQTEQYGNRYSQIIQSLSNEEITSLLFWTARCSRELHSDMPEFAQEMYEAVMMMGHSERYVDQDEWNSHTTISRPQAEVDKRKEAAAKQALPQPEVDQ